MLGKTTKESGIWYVIPNLLDLILRWKKPCFVCFLAVGKNCEKNGEENHSKLGNFGIFSKVDLTPTNIV